MDVELQIGDTVTWRWAAGLASGTVTDIIPAKATIHTKGKLVTRNGTPDDPAIIIRHTSGSEVIKLLHEVSPK